MKVYTPFYLQGQNQMASSSAAAVPVLDFTRLGPHGYLKGKFNSTTDGGFFSVLLNAGMTQAHVGAIAYALDRSRRARIPFQFEAPFNDSRRSDYLNARDILLILSNFGSEISEYLMINYDAIRVRVGDLGHFERIRILNIPGPLTTELSGQLITDAQVKTLADRASGIGWSQFSTSPLVHKYLETIIRNVDYGITVALNSRGIYDEFSTVTDADLGAFAAEWATEGNSMCIHCGSVPMSS